MEFMTIKEAAEKWNLSVRRVQTICNEGMIEGAMKFGNTWAIPKNAVKPADKRIKSGKYIVIRQIKRCLLRQIKTGFTEHLTMV